MNTEGSRCVTVVLEFPDADDGVTPELREHLDGLETTLAGQRCIVRVPVADSKGCRRKLEKPSV